MANLGSATASSKTKYCVEWPRAPTSACTFSCDATSRPGRTATLTSDSGTARRAELADVFLQMPVPRIGMFEFEPIDELVRTGYEFAMRTLLEQRALLLEPGQG